MASYFEIYIARHAEPETRIRRRETVEEFRKTVLMRNQDDVKETFDLLRAMAESQIEERQADFAGEEANEPASD